MEIRSVNLVCGPRSLKFAFSEDRDLLIWIDDGFDHAPAEAIESVIQEGYMAWTLADELPSEEEVDALGITQVESASFDI